MPPRIAMVAGEASGDLLASHLIRAIKRHLPDAEFFGIGGPKMQAEGFDARWPAELLAVHGYVDALKRYRQLSAIRKTLLKQIRRERPAAFIGVDAPDFNLWLEGKVKDAGMPAIHFVSPSIWAWRGGRIKRIARSVTRMLCLFPFEPELYDRAGVPVSYVGHPLADVFPLEPDRAAARERLGLPTDRKIIALLPGSRQSEVRNLADTFIETAAILAQRFEDVSFLVPLATRETRELFDEALARNNGTELPIRMLFGHAVDAMTAADAVLVASGTASLEAALLKRPMVISYRIGKWQYRLMKRMAYLPWVGLPNILCRETLVPELLQDDATPVKLADALAHWLNDPAACAALEQRFAELHLSLRQNTAERAAAAILPYLMNQPACQPSRLPA
ncbi:lipid-A-disaccharide synthase [Azoarcus sp. DD4]|uniref:lipid-A-disaccharide synthase n=1 Tax=Azoarcus sp. DD4 TaxID=2027405 RepID=UPI00112D7AB9|nr:lipid-A-disaccharide synthase [Azoarcus sp. DD4]QDF97279.1 lipid-A-disaccharide synthase [Azoarcus sp. DD4]